MDKILASHSIFDPTTSSIVLHFELLKITYSFVVLVLTRLWVRVGKYDLLIANGCGCGWRTRILEEWHLPKALANYPSQSFYWRKSSRAQKNVGHFACEINWEDHEILSSMIFYWFELICEPLVQSKGYNTDDKSP